MGVAIDVGNLAWAIPTTIEGPDTLRGWIMEPEQLVVMLLIGAVAGWLAGLIVKGGGYGLPIKIIVGIVGAVIGGWLFGVLGISVGGEWVGPIVTSTTGAVVLLFGISLVKK